MIKCLECKMVIADNKQKTIDPCKCGENKKFNVVSCDINYDEVKRLKCK